ncbi:M20/M25/M40 family metallo-hydrolase [Cellulophaga sp. Hel_I_12]|uniref:M20/M25/M40 family metallo-hydrolase n=1 Tax=Cellulophaga sp. Hel_I_12 TaxID=1249972 RepID=UPI00064768C4|nr:M20/M25/M40 family metallo-hydrolase [Cellulophaga sp. Hel_I_12]
MKTSKLFYTFLCAFFIFSGNGHTQKLSKTNIYEAAEEAFPTAIFEYISFLEIPNDGHYPDQIESNLQACKTLFTDLGFETKTFINKGIPVLFAEKKYHKKAKTVLFYLQIDGQPVDSAAWDQPSPFKPVLKEKQNGEWKIIDITTLKTDYHPDWRIFARSSSDSKGPAMSLISALQILQKKAIKPAFNVKVIMDFQEEMGSPTLPQAVRDNKEVLAADMLFIMDGTRHVSNLPTLTYGARGIATAQLKTFGSYAPLHSGQYGNFAPNPVFETARLIAGLKDENGRVTLPGFYDGISLSEKDKEEINKVPESKESILVRIGTSKADAVGDTYQEALQYPSLNIRGLNAAWVGDEVRTIIPSEVITEIDMRLVPESDGTKLMESLKKYISDSGYYLVDAIPTAEERKLHPKLASFTYKLGSKPFRTAMDSPIGHFLNKAMEKVFGEQRVNMRTTGGSQPMSPFITTLDIPAVSIRIPNPDNNIHAPNENLRIGNFLEGIITCLAILDQPID